MRKTLATAWSLISVLALFGCAASGPVVKPAVCPKPPPPQPALMKAPDYSVRVRAELFEP